ncbi:hypothetical protein PN499_12350 [Kamptonema animale CS-326]|nr:hypothetical protein [Kamptonema animale]MDB9511978.1 hypothetical protein [Kamptonema animale CS-326]
MSSLQEVGKANCCFANNFGEELAQMFRIDDLKPTRPIIYKRQ